jgi:hypothetical protein
LAEADVMVFNYIECVREKLRAVEKEETPGGFNEQ